MKINTKSVLLSVLLVGFISSSCTKQVHAFVFEELNFSYGFLDDDHLALGNISDAQENTMYSENYLMEKLGFTLSYNASKMEPNWVSWHLSEADFGSVKLDRYFCADATLPANWKKVEHKHYSNTGLTRGHNCPSGDRTNTEEAQKATYVMTNMIPQTGNNNNKTWNNLEIYIRDEVKKGKEAYIVMGHYGLGAKVCDNGNGAYDCTKYRNRNVHYLENEQDGILITVPKRIFKVILLLPNGDNDYQRIEENIEGIELIAVDTPNSDDLSFDWTDYIVTVEEIEKNVEKDIYTGEYFFFKNFAPELRKKLVTKKYDYINN